jgi:hypothetical protein
MPHTPDAASLQISPPAFCGCSNAASCAPPAACAAWAAAGAGAVCNCPPFARVSLRPTPRFPRPRSHSCDVGPWNISRMIVIPPDVGHGGVPRAADQPRCGKPAKPQIGLIVTRCVNVTEPAANPARSPLLVMPLATTTLLPLLKSRTRLTQFNRRKLRHSKPPGIVCPSGGGNLSRTCGSVVCHIRQAKAKEEVGSTLNGGTREVLIYPRAGLADQNTSSLWPKARYATRRRMGPLGSETCRIADSESAAFSSVPSTPRPQFIKQTPKTLMLPYRYPVHVDRRCVKRTRPLPSSQLLACQDDNHPRLLSLHPIRLTLIYGN